jgi:ABC-type nitrate/sulfonate/bicarbonate transport system permease component
MTKEDKQLLEMAKVFHMPKLRIFKYIILPALLRKKGGES